MPVDTPFCSSCRAAVPADARFCPQCGTRLGAVTPTYPTAEAAPVAAGRAAASGDPVRRSLRLHAPVQHARRGGSASPAGPLLRAGRRRHLAAGRHDRQAHRRRGDGGVRRAGRPRQRYRARVARRGPHPREHGHAHPRIRAAACRARRRRQRRGRGGGHRQRRPPQLHDDRRRREPCRAARRVGARRRNVHRRRRPSRAGARARRRTARLRPHPRAGTRIAGVETARAAGAGCRARHADRPRRRTAAISRRSSRVPPRRIPAPRCSHARTRAWGRRDWRRSSSRWRRAADSGAMRRRSSISARRRAATRFIKSIAACSASAADASAAERRDALDRAIADGIVDAADEPFAADLLAIPQTHRAATKRWTTRRARRQAARAGGGGRSGMRAKGPWCCWSRTCIGRRRGCWRACACWRRARSARPCILLLTSRREGDAIAPGGPTRRRSASI